MTEARAVFFAGNLSTPPLFLFQRVRNRLKIKELSFWGVQKSAIECARA